MNIIHQILNLEEKLLQVNEVPVPVFTFFLSLALLQPTLILSKANLGYALLFPSITTTTYKPLWVELKFRMYFNNLITFYI